MSGVVTVVSGAKGTEARLIQAAFAYGSAAVQIIYLIKTKRPTERLKPNNLSPRQILLCYLPFALTLLTMVVYGINLTNIKLSACNVPFYGWA